MDLLLTLGVFAVAMIAMGTQRPWVRYLAIAVLLVTCSLTYDPDRAAVIVQEKAKARKHWNQAFEAGIQAMRERIEANEYYLFVSILGLTVLAVRLIKR